MASKPDTIKKAEKCHSVLIRQLKYEEKKKEETNPSINHERKTKSIELESDSELTETEAESVSESETDPEIETDFF